MSLSQAVRTTPVAVTTKARGVAAMALGGALAVAMASFMVSGGFKPLVLATFGSVLLAGLAAVTAGVALFRSGTMTTLHKGVVIGTFALVAIMVVLLNHQLGLSAR
jgi:hypothetical protein